MAANRPGLSCAPSTGFVSGQTTGKPQSGGGVDWNLDRCLRDRESSRSTMQIHLALCWLALLATPLFGSVPATVPVGNPGNHADGTGYGAVSYRYLIGKYEVTNEEYCAFLNGVASRDPHELYDGRMSGEHGGILRSGSPGSFTYRTKKAGARKPVNFVTWESCARYANWLSNGGGKGDTENGSYQISGSSITTPDHAQLAKGKTVKWVIASENEWYKAAYYDPKKKGYWPYAVAGGNPPSCNINSGGIQAAGSYSSARSPYGTFDQNGNLWEYNESRASGKVGLRGGSYFINDNASYLRSSTRYDVLSAKWPNYGFRVAALGVGKVRVREAPVPSPPARVQPTRPPKVRNTPATFHVSQSGGNDRWDGSLDKPWKTLARASIPCLPGDSILLKRGDTWDEELSPAGEGTEEKPVTIGAYGKGAKPIIDRGDFRQDLTGIRLSDQGGFRIVGIEFARCMTGIYADYSDDGPAKKFIWIEDCYFRDSLHYQHYEDYPRRKIGLGICFFSHERDNRIVLSDITIRNCVFRRLASGVWTNSPDNFNKNASYIYNFRNLVMEDCLFEEGYQWPQGIRGVDKGLMRNCITHDIGRGFRSFNGVAGSMFFRCKNWTFENCEWGFISIGLGSGDGQAFDFEGNCDDMVMRNCLFHDTDGPGFLLCCYASDGHAHSGIVMENCVINGKSKRPIGLPRCAIVNTTDWNESTWKNCRFYLSPGEALMRVMDPEKDKKTRFVDCLVQDLSKAASTENLALEAATAASSQLQGFEAGAINDGNTETAWKPSASGEQWVQIVFPSERTINELRIREAPSSTVVRYEIQYADARTRTWKSCFNGREIGPDFIAPIVARKTRGFRLRIIETVKGSPAIREFSAFEGGARPFSDPNGVLAGKTIGR